jgi:hypothetical protein
VIWRDSWFPRIKVIRSGYRTYLSIKKLSDSDKNDIPYLPSEQEGEGKSRQSSIHDPQSRQGKGSWCKDTHLLP